MDDQDQTPKGPFQSPQPSGPFSRITRGLWFAAGVFFAIFGVLAALLFNLSKPSNVRNEAVRLAVWGMLAGFLVEIIVVLALGGVEGLSSVLGFPGAPSSGGSVF